MKNKTIERVACYVRVSTKEQSEHGYSIDEQTTRLKAYCKAMGWKITKVYTDGGYSGANTNRPALQDLILASQRHSIDAVVVYKLDRLSRSQKDTLTLIEGFLDNGVAFISMTESFDTSTPFGRATVGILSCFAQLERENIKERTQIGKEARAKEGKFHGGGFAPIGYDYKDGQLIVNEYEAMQVRMIHELFQQGESFRRIEKIMGEKGYSHKNGTWYPNNVKRVLLNPLYTGKINHHGETIEGQHEAIVDDKTYNKTMTIYNQQVKRNVKNMGRSLLGGIVYCARCGAHYTSTITSRTPSKIYRYYTCNSRCKKNRRLVRDENCKNDIWKAEELEELILNEVRKLKVEDIEPPKSRKKDSILIENEIKKIDSQISRMVDLYSVEGISFDVISKKIADLEERKAKLTTKEEPKKGYLVKSLKEAIELGNDDQVRAIVRSLIDHIEIDGEDVTIYWSF